MSDPHNSKKPIRYGLTPVAFIELGWIAVIVVPMILSAVLFRLIQWWLH